MSEIKGLATGIGSLPHKDIEAALDLIFKYLPYIPFWPQLPKRDKREGMVIQFMQHVAPVPQSPEGEIFGSDAYPSLEKRLEEFYGNIIAENIDYFKITEDYASGLYAFKRKLENEPKLLDSIKFIKCHITGPFTVASSLKDEDGKAYLHNAIAMQAFIKGLTMKALWQINFLKEFKKKIIVFIDEPYLGCFGSAFTPLNREDAVKGLTELTEGIKSEDVLLGVHCCGNTDWSIFTDIKALDIINFDAFGFLDKLALYADNLKGFFKLGGILCWGIVPTQELTDRETAVLLTEKIKSGIDTLVRKGLDKDLVSNNLLVSPACGLGTLDIRSSEKIFKLLSEISLSIRKNP